MTKTKPWKIAFGEIGRLFTPTYAIGQLEYGAFDDGRIRRFHALQWNNATRRAEVNLPGMGAVPFLALGALSRCPQHWEYHEVWYEYCGDYVVIPEETSRGIEALQEMHRAACERLGVEGWAGDDEDPDQGDASRSNSEGGHGREDNSEGSEDYDNDDSSDDEDEYEVRPRAVAAYKHACAAYGVGCALSMALQELEDDPSDLTAFTWNRWTEEPEVLLLRADGSPILVPVIDLGEVDEDAVTGRMMVWRPATEDEVVVTSEQAGKVLDYLFRLRLEAEDDSLFRLRLEAEDDSDSDDDSDAASRSASPTTSALSQESQSGSPGRVFAARSASMSPAAATPSNETYYTASAAAGAAMDLDEPVDGPTSGSNEIEYLPKTVTVEVFVKEEPLDNDAELLLHADYAHVA